MVKQAVDNTINWFRVTWPILVLVITLSLSGMKAFTELSSDLNAHCKESDQKFVHINEDIKRIDEHGSQELIQLKADVQGIKVKIEHLQNSSDKNSTKLDKIQELLMGP